MPDIDLSARSLSLELMDLPSVSYSDREGCLHDLETVNAATLAYKPTLAWLDGMAGKARQAGGGPLKILDTGCGGGDGLRRIWRWARRRGIEVELTGLDLCPHTCAIATRRTPADAPVTYITANVFEYAPSKPFDFIVNALFAHHLRHQEIICLMQWMDRHTARGWFINDLHRHWLPYHFIRHAAAWFRLDPMVRHDAPLSVARGFTAGEWHGFLAEAGIASSRSAVKWHFPFRYGISCRKE